MEHIALSKEAAKEGMVLLKNEGEVLPLKKGSKVALFGKAAFDYVKGGGGSGDVTVSGRWQTGWWCWRNWHNFTGKMCRNSMRPGRSRA